MKKQLEHFLLGFLWLLAVTLAGCFWFNIRFGFNIFERTHWEYLGQLQASHAGIAPSFYISIIIIAVIMLTGMYFIMRPKFRKITMMHAHTTVPTATPTVTAPVPDINAQHSPRPMRPVGPKLSAPPPQQSPVLPITPAAPVMASAPPAPVSSPSVDFDEINDAFKDSGYTVKAPPKIDGMRPALFAIGPNETVWVGAVGIESERMQNIINKLHDIFTDTLEDIPINIMSFIIGPQTPVTGDIKKFDSVNQLRNYISNEPARLLDDAETEDFNAYSEYIDTVSDYFNKL